VQEQAAQAAQQNQAIRALRCIVRHHHDRIEEAVDRRAQPRQPAQDVDIARLRDQRPDRVDRVRQRVMQIALGAGFECGRVDVPGRDATGLTQNVADTLVRRRQRLCVV